MGFLSPFEYKSRKNGKFWLHVKERGGSKVYYFSKEQADAVMFRPFGYVVAEHKLTGMPMLKKDKDSLWVLLFPPIPKANAGKKKQS